MATDRGLQWPPNACGRTKDSGYTGFAGLMGWVMIPLCATAIGSLRIAIDIGEPSNFRLA